MAVPQDDGFPQNTRNVSGGFGQMRQGSRIWLYVQGALSLIVGILFIALPIESALFISIFFGAWLAVTGLTGIIAHFTREKELRSGWGLFSSIVSLIAGVLALAWPGTAAVAITFIVTIWALAMGIGYIVSSFRFRQLGARYWWGILIAGIVAVLLGIAMAAAPGATLLGLIWAVGIFAIVDGISEIMLGFKLRKSE
ncbi:MAG: HdeD family acid-resistance protein [Ancrocorticia sp.]|uniref:HdeD family acid-resistance protein n=1 Tax=Ancrocorticia sp. TaxID=2593684 RepID=UPI003F8D9B87